MNWDLTTMFPVTLAQTSDVTPESAPAAPAAPAEGETQTTAADGSTSGGGSNTSDKPGSLSPIVLMAIVVAVMLVFMLRGQGKEKKKRAELLASLKKGDKVQTVGGILGTIVEVRDDRVIVKIDENTNTRVPFARSAIQNVISESDSDEKK